MAGSGNPPCGPFSRLYLYCFGIVRLPPLFCHDPGFTMSIVNSSAKRRHGLGCSPGSCRPFGEASTSRCGFCRIYRNLYFNFLRETHRCKNYDHNRAERQLKSGFLFRRSRNFKDMNTNTTWKFHGLLVLLGILPLIELNSKYLQVAAQSVIYLINFRSLTAARRMQAYLCDVAFDR